MTSTPTLGKSRFESELQVRPDDIDMFQHVHSSRYMDYVLAARYDQMKRCYGMAMEDFLEAGFGWVVQKTTMEFKRPLRLGDRFIVRTWIEQMFPNGVLVHFEIDRQANGKRCCQGEFHYTLVHRDTGRAASIPDHVRKLYAV